MSVSVVHEDRESSEPPQVKKRLLVVDDNVDAAQMLGMLLEAAGHEVLIEHDAKTALLRARTEAPDFYLLDIGLPDVDGNELARRLRAQSETTKAVLIAVTGYGQELDRKNTAQAGFDYHFVKPVDMRRLLEILAG
jgi:DNA-binding response OmpR family regulator